MIMWIDCYNVKIYLLVSSSSSFSLPRETAGHMTAHVIRFTYAPFCYDRLSSSRIWHLFGLHGTLQHIPATRKYSLTISALASFSRCVQFCWHFCKYSREDYSSKWLVSKWRLLDAALLRITNNKRLFFFFFF